MVITIKTIKPSSFHFYPKVYILLWHAKWSLGLHDAHRAKVDPEAARAGHGPASGAACGWPVTLLGHSGTWASRMVAVTWLLEERWRIPQNQSLNCKMSKNSRVNMT